MYIISPSKQFVFIHIPKTAGVSISTRLEPYKDSVRVPGLHPHVQGNTIRQCIGNVFDSYFTFAFVRNPWARMFSYYHFMRKDYPIHKNRYDRVVKFGKGSFMTQEFNDWLVNGEFFHRSKVGHQKIPEQRRSQLNWLTDASGKNVIVDFIGKVETIDKDWQHICEKIDISYEPLPVANRSQHTDYRTAYTQEAKDFIAVHFAHDIEMFGYTFE